MLVVCGGAWRDWFKNQILQVSGHDTETTAWIPALREGLVVFSDENLIQEGRRRLTDGLMQCLQIDYKTRAKPKISIFVSVIF